MMTRKPLTPGQIYTAQIRTRWIGGYDIDQVDDLLDQCAETVAFLADALQQVSEKLSETTKRLAQASKPATRKTTRVRHKTRPARRKTMHGAKKTGSTGTKKATK